LKAIPPIPAVGIGVGSKNISIRKNSGKTFWGAYINISTTVVEVCMFAQNQEDFAWPVRRYTLDHLEIFLLVVESDTLNSGEESSRLLRIRPSMASRIPP
jgi:hypothetical protein